MNPIKSLKDICLNSLVRTKLESPEIDIPFNGIPSNIINEILKKIISINSITKCEKKLNGLKKHLLLNDSQNECFSKKLNLKFILDIIIKDNLLINKIEFDEIPASIINKLFNRAISMHTLIIRMHSNKTDEKKIESEEYFKIKISRFTKMEKIKDLIKSKNPELGDFDLMFQNKLLNLEESLFSNNISKKLMVCYIKISNILNPTGIYFCDFERVS